MTGIIINVTGQATGSVLELNLMTFLPLGLSKDLLDAVKFAGYAAPTSVQKETIPHILKGGDLIAQAKTGTGKTASFALPLLQLLQESTNQDKKVIRVLILAPTRELAMQVEHALKSYGRSLTKPIRTIALVGGLNIDLQIRYLHHGADMAVATPGRLLDLLKRGAVDLSHLKILVVDEADKMFDMGFSEELEAVLRALPVSRQNLLFSATITDKVMALAGKFMVQPLHVMAEEGPLVADLVVQRAIAVNRHNRGPLLRHLITTETWDHVLVFVASARDADIIAAKLLKAGIEANAFHGGLTQAQRGDVLGGFKARKFKVLVATDLAARGLNINKLPYVVNYDLPRSPDDYIHRIGRTARAGEKGVAISFIGHEDEAHFKLIEKRTHIRLPRESIVGFELTGEALPAVKGPAPVKGHRMSKKDKLRALGVKDRTKKPLSSLDIQLS
ncbi:MAG: DEAD/DEAH box helicase [Candidatus Omnitrophota bacterium]